MLNCCQEPACTLWYSTPRTCGGSAQPEGASPPCWSCVRLHGHSGDGAGTQALDTNLAIAKHTALSRPQLPQGPWLCSESLTLVAGAGGDDALRRRRGRRSQRHPGCQPRNRGADHLWRADDRDHGAGGRVLLGAGLSAFAKVSCRFMELVEVALRASSERNTRGRRAIAAGALLIIVPRLSFTC